MFAEADEETRPVPAAPDPPFPNDKPGDGAPFIVGVIGKRETRGLDRTLRAALDRAFEEIDRSLPHSPKILLSSLAVGADTIAAEAALARVGWRVVAPLPFRRALYEADFEAGEDLARLRALLAHPRVHVRELAPLRRPSSDQRYTDDELRRTTPSPPHRTLHYEQAGLFIVERAALIIAVVDAEPGPDRLGGTDRMVSTRLHGPDGLSLDVRSRSDELLAGVGVLDPRCGPLWRIALDASDGPQSICVQLPDEAKPTPLGRNRATADSLALGRRLDEFNRRSVEAPRPAAASLDATARLADLRKRLAYVQALMKSRVRWSVWAIAALFLFAIVSLETHIGFRRYEWSKAFAVSYFAFATAAVALYVWGAFRRWQPLAEDYRAAAEALRTQIVLWNFGIERRGGRVDLGYLRGMRGEFGEVRDTVGQLVEGAQLLAPPSPPNPSAVTRWLEDQSAYFSSRIARRSIAMRRVQTMSSFLFVFGLAVSAAIAWAQSSAGHAAMASITAASVAAGERATFVAAELAILGLLFALVWRVRVGDRAGPVSVTRRLSMPAAAVLAGVVATRALCDAAALLPPPQHIRDLYEFRIAQAEDLMAMCAVTTTALAGAIRFVADKLSLEAELQGFEHAGAYFERAREALRDLEAGGEPVGRRRNDILEELVAEALRESESWLFAHRERPLEPIVGG